MISTSFTIFIVIRNTKFSPKSQITPQKWCYPKTDPHQEKIKISLNNLRLFESSQSHNFYCFRPTRSSQKQSYVHVMNFLLYSACMKLTNTKLLPRHEQWSERETQYSPAKTTTPPKILFKGWASENNVEKLLLQCSYLIVY